MNDYISLIAADGHELGAYVSYPAGEPIAGLVVVQEIFGVNAHIRSVADGYAKDGFLAIAPALFDRYERGVDLSYEGQDLQRARSFVPKLNMEKAVQDVAAAIQYAEKSTNKKVGVIGYCFGGTVAWLAATRLHPAAVVGYYAGGIGNFAQEKAGAPAMLHFGEQDTHIPEADVNKLKAANPGVEIFWYDAGHAFNAEPRSSYNPDAARLARERSLAFLKKNLT